MSLPRVVLAVLSAVVLLVGCPGPTESSNNPVKPADGGTRGAGVPDAGVDAGVPDAGVPDAGMPDAGRPDAGTVTDGGCSPVIPSDSQSVTYQIDTVHSGQQPGDWIGLPLCRRWEKTFPASVSYPVVAEHRVFITVGSIEHHSSVYALDVATGNTLWGPVSIGGTYAWSALAYGEGAVFAISDDGLLTKLDAATGAVVWSEHMGQYSFSSAPTVRHGKVFLSGSGEGGNVYAIHAGDGGLLWTQEVANGDDSSPAVTDDGVYVSYACNQAYGFAADSGTLLWHHTSNCSGGGGKTVAVHGGLVYTRDEDDLLLDTASGTEQGTYASYLIPAFNDAFGFFSHGYGLSAWAPGAASASWTFKGTSDTQVDVAPLVVGDLVVVGRFDGVYALWATDGGVASKDTKIDPSGPDEQNVSSPLAGMAAAEGRLFVPAGTKLVAY